jgi:hypothetical protein
MVRASRISAMTAYRTKKFAIRSRSNAPVLKNLRDLAPVAPAR